MTPAEESQSSAESMEMEEPSTAPPNPLPSNSGQIRVRNISELNNDNEAEASPSSPKKRCLQNSVDLKKNEASAVNENPESSVSTSNDHDGESRNENVNNVEIKNNHVESTDAGADKNNVDPNVASTSNHASSSTAVNIKAEPIDNDSGSVGQIIPTSLKDIKPAIKVEKEEATSSTTRISCKFGIRCYRQNPMHRREEAHPGDKDYKRPDFPNPPDGAPDCPYGDLCYRRNPVHFQQFRHPDSIDSEKNWKNHMLLRKRKQNQQSTSRVEDDEEDDYDLLDPFIDNGSSDEFNISNEDEDEDDEDYF